jgi:hypothetical protein
MQRSGVDGSFIKGPWMQWGGTDGSFTKGSWIQRGGTGGSFIKRPLVAEGQHRRQLHQGGQEGEVAAGERSRAGASRLKEHVTAWFWTASWELG